ncbi:MAG: DNA replication and repair protein RecF [Acidobacteria bacterium]|nr:DNA replication and repair protein RecF [Acidobacteriota bacterium]
MFLQSLNIDSFRNLHPAQVRLDPGVNLLLGNNGEGKTNLLEAVYVLASSKSFRTRHLGECVQHRAAGFSVSGRVHAKQTEPEIAVCWRLGTKDLHINDKRASLFQYLGNLDALIMSFEQLPVVRGGPEERRRFLDRGIVQIKKTYLKTLTEFHHILRQRNELLARIHKDKARAAELQPWQALYAERALEVTAARSQYVQRLNALLPEVRFATDLLSVKYAPSVRDARPESFCATLASLQQEEIARMRTLRGPHRDELKILLGDNEIQKYGSGGQQRSAMFSLLLAGIRLYFVENNEYPLLLIDDLDAELDVSRVQTLLDRLPSHCQVMITCSKESVLKSICYVHYWGIQEGVLSRVAPAPA